MKTSKIGNKDLLPEIKYRVNNPDRIGPVSAELLRRLAQIHVELRAVTDRSGGAHFMFEISLFCDEADDIYNEVLLQGRLAEIQKRKEARP